MFYDPARATYELPKLPNIQISGPATPRIRIRIIRIPCSPIATTVFFITFRNNSDASGHVHTPRSSKTSHVACPPRTQPTPSPDNNDSRDQRVLRSDPELATPGYDPEPASTHSPMPGPADTPHPRIQYRIPLDST